jgi:hypothetical protein
LLRNSRQKAALEIPKESPKRSHAGTPGKTCLIGMVLGKTLYILAESVDYPIAKERVFRRLRTVPKTR